MKLYPGRSIDVQVTGHSGRSFEAQVNRLLGRLGCWRLGRSNGTRALLRTEEPYRQIRLWFR